MAAITANSQTATTAFLEGQTRERIDTHAAMVFLSDDRAYKLMRAVRFSYLDFSTLERREAACRAEVVLNRRTIDDLYLGVRAITEESDGRIAFDGTGKTIDWVIEMHCFDQTLLFDRLAERGELTDALMESLSAEIARFHAAAEVTPGMGGQASLATEIEGNEQNLALAPSDAFSHELCISLVQRWRTELATCAGMMDQRDRTGHVRRCHGDLHLRNIVLWHGRPALFDCIEFSEHLSCIDVLYDVAFLLMDLEHRRLRPFANVIFNAYLDRTDEAAGIGVLPLMMSLRAAIRAHTGVAAASAQSHPERRQEIIDEARAYLVLADRLLQRPQPHLIAVGGISGTGKSTLVKALAPACGAAPGARILHTDALRKRRFSVEPTVRLGAYAYTPAVNAAVYRAQREATLIALRSGYSAIVDGVFSLPEERTAIAALADECGVPFTGLWLTAPLDVLRSRVEARTEDMSDATVDVLAQQSKTNMGNIDWLQVDTHGTLAETFGHVRAAIALNSPAVQAG